MPGPTTEAINEDVKALREDLHQVELSLTRSIEAVRHDVGKLQTEFGLAKWLLGLLLVATLSGIGTGIWWASKIDTKVGALEGRFDRLESAVLKAIEQPKTPPMMAPSPATNPPIPEPIR